MSDARLLSRLVHFHTPRASQAHDPNMACPGGKELPDLELLVRFVLAGVGIFDGQRRRTLGPSGLVGDLAHGEIRSAERFRGE